MAKRLIDAEALPVHKAYCVDEAGFGANFYVVDKSDIDNAPTVDAVEVVRCRECKMEAMCNITQRLGENGFCSYGERRRENERKRTAD